MAIIEYRFVKTVIIDTDTNQVLSTSETVETKEGQVLPILATPAKRTKKAETKLIDDDSEPSVKLEDNKLVLNASAMKAIDAVPGDRVTINYVEREDGTFAPIISKSGVYGDPVGGNKLTKSGTVMYKGKQATSLLQYGKNFVVDPTVKDVAKYALALVDPNAEIMIDIKEDELIPTPKISTDDFMSFDKKNDETLENQTESITFGFDLNDVVW